MTFDVAPDDTVEWLKFLIEERCGAPTETQQLGDTTHAAPRSRMYGEE
eukprot:gene52900-41537_t